jgi:hypothetical protein
MFEKLFQFLYSNAVAGNAIGNTGHKLRLQTLRTVLFVIKGTCMRLRKTMGGAIPMGAFALHIGKLELLTAIRKGTTSGRHC